MAKTVNKSTKTPKKTASVGDLFAQAPAAARRETQRAQATPRPETPRPKPAARSGSAEFGYTAKHIEVLEGLEPVRRRPGMYIGGTDEKALHHLFAEVIDNAMDEALAGHATFIEVELDADGFVTVTDNGRGIPVDPHPKFKNKSALEVIMCTLHAGGKFDSEVYETSGGLHGVGVSVANALSDRLEVEVWREQKHYRMAFERGKPKGKLEKLGRVPNQRGTKVRFHPDPQIFGPRPQFKPERLFKMTRSKAYLFGGVEIRWSCDKELVRGTDDAGGGHVPFRRRPEGLSRRYAVRRDARASRHLHRHRRARPARTAARNGRSPGPRTPTASSTPTATRSRRRTAARTSPACAARCCAGSRITPSASARASARPRSPAKT